MHIQLVGRYRKHAPEPLLLLEKRGADVHKARLENGAHFGLDFIYLLARTAVDGEIQSDLKNALLRLLQRVAQLFEVGVRRVEHRVPHHSLLLARRYLALHLSDLFLEFAQHLVGVHRVDEYGNVDDFVHVDDGSEPARRQKARVRDDEEGARDFFSEVQLAGIDAQWHRRDDVLEVQNTRFVYLFGENRKHVGTLDGLLFCEYI